MSINAAKTILGGLLPFAANPVVLTVIGIGAATWAVASLFDDKEDKASNGTNEDTSRSERCGKPLNRTAATVKTTVPATVNEPLEAVEVTIIETIKATTEKPFGTDGHAGNHGITNEPDTLNEDAENKEMIRKAMSELGKRSAAARARKKISK